MMPKLGVKEIIIPEEDDDDDDDHGTESDRPPFHYLFWMINHSLISLGLIKA